MEQAVYHPYPPNMGPTAVPDDPILLERVRAQVEFYFSPQNLARDTFLRSLLEQNNNAVPVETIANFPKVRELHGIGRLGIPPNVSQAQMPPADPYFLCRALEPSLVVTVSNNGQWIHLITTTTIEQHNHGMATPNQESSSSIGGGETTTETALPSSPSSPSTTASSAGVPTHPIPPRTTIVLHDLPEGTTVQEILAVFSSSTQPKSANTFGNGSMWYIDFDSEQTAMAALAAVVNETVQGMPIRASLKNDAPLQSIPAQQQMMHPQQHQQYAYAAPLMQGYPVYEYHPYYGVPILPPQQQHYYQGGPPPQQQQQAHPHYATMYRTSPLPPQQQQQHYPPNNGYAPPPMQYGYQHPPHQQQMEQRPYKKKNKQKGKGGNYNNRNKNYDRNDRQDYKDDDQRSNERSSRGDANEESTAAPTTVEIPRPTPTTDSQHSNDGGGGKRKKKNKRKGSNKQNEVLGGQENFPALVENQVKGSGASKTAPQGYAAALKKQSVSLQPAATRKPPPPPPEETSTTQQLEERMSNLTVSKQKVEPGFWIVDEHDETQVPEVW